MFAIEELEETAKLYLLLRGLNPRYLSPEQVKDLTDVFGLTLPEHGHEHCDGRAVTLHARSSVEAVSAWRSGDEATA